MQKRFSFITVIICLLLCACSTSSVQDSTANTSNNRAQSNPDRGTADLQIGGGTVQVEYGRPALKGRELEKMIEPGQEWRMGSNAATTLSTDIDLKFGDKVVPKGKYILKAKPVDQQNWLLIIQSEDKANVAEIPLVYKKVADSAELMTIKLEEKNNAGTFLLHWGQLSLTTDFQKA